MTAAFTDMDFQCRYRSGDVMALPRKFYNDVLPVTKSYRRAVGFFSSTSFMEISYGILGLVKNDGNMQLITSPKLNSDDVKAIQEGYEARETVYLRAFKREMSLPKTINERNRLNVLANLIEQGILEIKIAVTENPSVSMYHEKIGIFEDTEGNKIAISGSMNESETAISENFESFQVFCGWKGSEAERVCTCEADFDAMWYDRQPALHVFDFPDLPAELVRTYKVESLSKSELVKKSGEYIIEDFAPLAVESPTLPPNIPTMPSWLKLHDYQRDAIDNWAAQGYQGIFDMATGTGKTLTGLSALTRLYEDKGGAVCAIILCPYIHLVMQWIKDIESFNIRPIIAFGSSPQKDWFEKLGTAVSKRNFRDDGKGFFCLISTIATFKREKIQGLLKKLRKPTLLLADEAHNLGAANTSKYLPEDKFDYRIALSATLDRHFDEKGTKFLHDFFGKKCIEYGLREAIGEGFLTHYDYHPVTVALDVSEREEYKDLTKSILNEFKIDRETGKKKLTEKGKRLCIMRSRIIAGAKSKISALLNVLEPYKNNNMILIYCGATKYEEDAYSEDDDEKKDVRQIEEVMKRVYERYHMTISKFTAEENAKDRELLIQKFSEGKELQALAAIKCLDEGVNVPSIKTAFILASSTNPKEYIQRRGRVLRTAKGKGRAEIYDFITLPYDAEVISNKSIDENNAFKALASREVTRMREFSSLADNEIESLPLICKLEKDFELNNKSFSEEFIDE